MEQAITTSFVKELEQREKDKLYILLKPRLLILKIKNI